MDTLFLVIFLLSLFAIAIFGIIAVLQFVKKESAKGKKQLKLAGISAAVMVISFLSFGLTIDSMETASEEKTEVSTNNDEEETEETPEEKAAREAKEAEEKALAEQKAKEEAEAAAKAAEEARLKAEQEAAAKKANAQPIEFAQLKKNPDRYKGEYVKYTGEILQILEGDDVTHIRLAVTRTSYGYDFNDVIFVEYPGYTDFVDEDIVTVYGEIYGTYSYTSQAGYNISLPGLLADTVE